MASWLIDTPLGELIRAFLGSRWLPFPEEQSDWILRDAFFADGEKDEQPLQQQLGPPSAQLVGWYGNDDPANPQNWSPMKKARVYVTINYCACTVYMSSSIYTSSQDAVEEIFHASCTVASLGLALFVLAYGIGPLLFAPISEVHLIGRNIPYLISLAIFIIISVLTATASNMGALLTLRFLQGFFGSPALATGGASLSDISNTVWKPFALYTWAFFSFVGPSIGPVISTVAVERLGWRWSLWEIVFLTTPAFLSTEQLILPETSGQNILYRRAQRLNRRFPRCEFHLAEHSTVPNRRALQAMLVQALVTPWQVHLLSPAIMFSSLYCGLVYGIFYTFFETFPIAYTEIHHMSSVSTALVYLSTMVAVILVGIPYLIYIYCVVNPIVARGERITPEWRLIPAVIASFMIPAGLFLFAWTVRTDIHWMVPTVGVVFATGGMCIVLQSIFVYITLAYTQYAASILGGNGFIKSCVACAAILWSAPLYDDMGLPVGVSILGALCVLGVVGIALLYRFGGILRARSRFAQWNEK
ncbi:hypothetical protein AbraIFM66950_011814 [Aspergillus brasiliensis]|nr:hypothetical protein AbraIFM66950_011814 [Aspergillus brasiliensis]